MGLVIRALLRDLGRRPWQLALTVISIAAGVSVVVGVDIANESALEEFRLAGEITTGSATHRIVGGTLGLDESVYRDVRVDARIRLAAPVIEAQVAIPGKQGPWTLMGIEPLTDFRLRQLQPATAPASSVASSDIETSWPVFGPPELLEDGSGTVVLANGDAEQVFRIAGHTDMPGQQNSRVLVTDIAWAQDFLGMQGRLSHIDLRLRPDEVARLRARLVGEARLIDLAMHDGAREDMSRAFRINLTALSLLSLVVAMFLVYSAVSFQVVRRRQLFGLLGALGVTPAQMIRVLLMELLLVGVVGTLAGIALGILLAQTLTALVSGTINTLYHALAVADIHLSATTVSSALLVGLAATLFSGLTPIFLASRTPTVVLMRGQAERHGLRTHVSLLLPFCIALSIPAALLIIWPGESLVAPFSGLFLLICAMALLGPWLLHIAGRCRDVLPGSGPGLIPKMALGNAARHLDRTGVAVAALAVAVSSTLGVELMIRSFRHSVDDWLSHYLQADIYLSTAGDGNAFLSEAFITDLANLPSLEHLSTGRRLSLETGGVPITVFALDLPERGFEGFLVLEQLGGDLWTRFHHQGEVLISEPMARRQGLVPGDSIRIPTDRGLLPFTVAAVYRDYSSDRGLVTMHRKTWNRFYDDPRQVSAALYLAAGESPGDWIKHIKALPNAPPDMFIRSNRGLRETSLSVFDQTFRITGVLRWLAVIVAVIGIYSALMALLLERRREFDVLTAIGFSRRQKGGLLLAEAGLSGLVAGLVAVPLGMMLSLILIRVINLRSFGWSMDSLVNWSLVWQAIGLSLLAALAAALYPAWRFRDDDALRGLRDG